MVARPLRIALLTFEHLPHGSGIATVAHEVGSRLRARGHDVVTLAPGFPGIRIAPKSVFRWAGAGILAYWREAARAVARGSYDVVWSHNPLLSRAPRPRHVATVHTTFRALQRSKDARAAILTPYYATMAAIEARRLQALRGATFTAIDLQVADEIGGIVGTPIRIINNGVDTARYCPRDRLQARSELGVAMDGPLVLSLGRLTAQKRPLELLRAWARYERGGGSGTLVMVGTGELARSARAEAGRLGLHRVRFQGYVDATDKLRWLQAADLFVIASAYEGKPLAMLEALACGVPALVNDIPNLSFVSSIGAGAVTRFEDDETAAGALRRCIDDTAWQEKASRLAREYALAELDWSRIVDRYEEILTQEEG